MKKIMKIALALVLLSQMAFAGGGAQPKKAKAAKPKTLVEQGLSLISLMREKAENKNFVLFYSGNDEVSNIVQEIAQQDFSKPSAVYRLSGDFTTLFSLMTIAFDTSDMELSSELKEELSKQFLSAIATTWTASKAGEYQLAAASLLTCTKVFDSKELSQDCIFVYEFPGEYPVAVCFLRGEDNAVLAQSSFVIDKDFIKSLQDFLEEYDVITIKKLQ